jgi:hypothetical protein
MPQEILLHFDICSKMSEQSGIGMPEGVPSDSLFNSYFLDGPMDLFSHDALSPDGTLPEPFNPALHSIFIVGDSTAAYHIDRMNEGYAEAQGWGVFFYAFFDPDKVNIVNRSLGGRESRGDCPADPGPMIDPVDPIRPWARNIPDSPVCKSPPALPCYEVSIA